MTQNKKKANNPQQTIVSLQDKLRLVTAQIGLALIFFLNDALILFGFT